ncbi:YihY/virulence factor BrkB family protein [Nitrosococcus wardiae]|uniref:YihY/virulence factor BrkB family protein n=2 Tax=Nitrosococcus wardiae TaxID=1814290 RepID=A0A4P7C6B1_9GAMM|nr:YihY/virulence factor BrkB family protein [Nitrosococcus wardiae]
MSYARRGRSATRPREIPGKGWRDVLVRVKNELSEDKLTMVAAGVAFYALLALFPALTALVFIYGLVANPADVQQQLNTLSGIIPQEAQSLLNAQLSSITAQSPSALGFGVLGSILFALWGATKGMKTLMEALNVVYNEEEERGFLRLNGTALVLTLGAVLLGVLAIGLVVVLPALLGNLGLGESVRSWISLLRWPLLALFAMAGLAGVYRYGPSRSQPQWHWVNWGAVLATVLWVIASFGFSFYVSHFGSYNETYGSLGAVVIFLMWLFITAFIVLLGAELNAEMEHQTQVDTTEGEPQPMGQRRAYVADTVGGSPGHEASERSATRAQYDRAEQRAEAKSSRQSQPTRRETPQKPSAEAYFSTHTSRQPSASAQFNLEQERADEYLSRLGSVAKRHPVPTVLIGIGLTWFWLSHHRPTDMKS